MPFDPGHFAMPFRFVATNGVTDAVTVAQDSPEEVRTSIEVLLRCPLGFREELPEFGVPSPLFGQAPLSTDLIKRSVEQWEPRASIYAAEYGDLTDEAVRHITIEIQE